MMKWSRYFINKKSRVPIVGVMGPGDKASESDKKVAYELGKKIAEEGWILLTGGRNAGVMHAASRGAKVGNGLVIGIIPAKDTLVTSGAVDIPIITGMGSGRNNINILTSRVIIACGMGAGTASEVALAIKAHRNVILLNNSPESTVFFQKIGGRFVSIAKNVSDAVKMAKNCMSGY